MLAPALSTQHAYFLRRWSELEEAGGRKEGGRKEGGKAGRKEVHVITPRGIR
jgi:hypothetical protein